MVQLMGSASYTTVVMQRYNFEWYTVEYPTSHCIFWYTHEPLGECVYQENTSDESDSSRLHHEKALHNYFIPCHRKYSGQKGQHNQCEIRADLIGFEMAS